MKKIYLAIAVIILFIVTAGSYFHFSAAIVYRMKCYSLEREWGKGCVWLFPSVVNVVATNVAGKSDWNVYHCSDINFYIEPGFTEKTQYNVAYCLENDSIKLIIPKQKKTGFNINRHKRFPLPSDIKFFSSRASSKKTYESIERKCYRYGGANHGLLLMSSEASSLIFWHEESPGATMTILYKNGDCIAIEVILDGEKTNVSHIVDLLTEIFRTQKKAPSLGSPNRG